MKKYIFFLLLLAVGNGLPGYAGAETVDLEKIVVTPSRTQEKGDYNPNNLVVLNSRYLQKEDKFDLTEAFGEINGLDVVGGGKFGRAAEGIFIRGAQPRHTAYMLEGMKVYDPSNPSSYYVPANFSLSGVQRVEIVKTPLSTIYGSSPMGGAVNFLVKKPQGKPYLYLETEGGSYSTTEEIVELGGKKKGLSYLFNAARLDSGGFSKAREKNNNPEKDPYQNTNFLLNLNYNPEEEMELGLTTKAIHSRSELDDDDNYDGIQEDDLDNITWDNELISTLYLKQKLTDLLAYKLQGGHTSVYRRTQDDGEENVRDWYKGRTYQFLSNIEITPFEFFKAVTGFDYALETVKSFSYYSGWVSSLKRENNTKGFFLEGIITPNDSLRIDGSYRREENSLFKHHSVAKGGLNYKFPSTKTETYFTYSEGFKAPSIYQLYSSSGNRALKPEESKTWELGFAQPLGEKFTFTFSYFHSDFKSLIDFVYFDPVHYLGKYENAAKAKSRGMEIGFQLKPSESLQFKGGYTYMTGKQDFVDGDIVAWSLVSTSVFSHSPIRVPTNKAFFGINWKWQKIDASLDLSYVGKRMDRIWKTVGMDTFDEFVTLKPYMLGNIIINYNFSKDGCVFVKFNNIFNENYERINGFQEERAAFYGGLKLKL